MAPIRRYLRITRFSVLEVRIYLDNPAHAETWLLNSRDPALPRVIEAVRPLVLPKLREENENAKRKSGKKRRGVKDVISEEDFDVSIFLTETSTTHSLLTKQKQFQDKGRIKSNANKLTKDNPITVEDEEAPQILAEDEDESVRLQDIPEAPSNNQKNTAIELSSDEEQTAAGRASTRKRKRRTRRSEAAEEEGEDPDTADDKKKLALNTSYDGFSIYGRILCLIVKRKTVKKPATPGDGAVSGSRMLENWVSTQAGQDFLGDLDDDG